MQCVLGSHRTYYGMREKRGISAAWRGKKKRENKENGIKAAVNGLMVGTFVWLYPALGNSTACPVCFLNPTAKYFPGALFCVLVCPRKLCQQLQLDHMSQGRQCQPLSRWMQGVSACPSRQSHSGLGSAPWELGCTPGVSLQQGGSGAAPLCCHRAQSLGSAEAPRGACVCRVPCRRTAAESTQTPAGVGPCFEGPYVGSVYPQLNYLHYSTENHTHG